LTLGAFSPLLFARHIYSYPQVILSSFSVVTALGVKMNLILQRLALADARLKILARIEADLHAQFLELADLRERLREAQVSADQGTTRVRRPASVIVAASPRAFHAVIESEGIPVLARI
jgi:hypothetical protein